MDKESDRCKTEITEKGLEIGGECAQGLLEVLLGTHGVSKKFKSEIFGCACLNPETGKIEKAVIGNIGTSKSVSPKRVGRICPKGTSQISYHTHPVSGKAKFSAADGSVIVDRFNQEYDDGHCVVGDEEPRCIFQTKVKKERKL